MVHDKSKAIFCLGDVRVFKTMINSRSSTSRFSISEDDGSGWEGRRWNLEDLFETVVSYVKIYRLKILTQYCEIFIQYLNFFLMPYFCIENFHSNVEHSESFLPKNLDFVL